MRFLPGLLIFAFALFSGSECFAESCALVTIKNDAKKVQYKSTDFSYRKALDNVIVHHFEPKNPGEAPNRFFESKDNLKISTEIGDIKILSEKSFIIDSEDKSSSISFVGNQNYVAVSGSFILKDADGKQVLAGNGSSPLVIIDFTNNVFSVFGGKYMEYDAEKYSLATKKGAGISAKNSTVLFTKGSFKMSISFDFTPAAETLHCSIDHSN